MKLVASTISESLALDDFKTVYKGSPDGVVKAVLALDVDNLDGGGVRVFDVWAAWSGSRKPSLSQIEKHFRVERGVSGIRQPKYHELGYPRGVTVKVRKVY